MKWNENKKYFLYIKIIIMISVFFQMIFISNAGEVNNRQEIYAMRYDAEIKSTEYKEKAKEIESLIKKHNGLLKDYSEDDEKDYIRIAFSLESKNWEFFEKEIKNITADKLYEDWITKKLVTTKYEGISPYDYYGDNSDINIVPGVIHITDLSYIGIIYIYTNFWIIIPLFIIIFILYKLKRKQINTKIK